ncbi:uncharacterized protein LOC144859906 [Branchiostoma floridae x Branchiostoma japonicum]
MVRWSSVVVIALVAASQDGVFGARLTQRRSLSAQLPVQRLRHVRGKNGTMVHPKLLLLQSKGDREKGSHVTITDVGRAESPEEKGSHVTVNDVGRAESPEKEKDSHVTVNDVGRAESPEKGSHVTVNDVGRAESPEEKEKGSHVTVNDVGRVESPEKKGSHVTVNDVGEMESPEKKYHAKQKDFHPSVKAANKDPEKKLATKTCTSPRCQVTPYCSYNNSEISCSCAEEGENETEAEVNCTLYNLAAIFDVFHEDATVTSVCVETQFLPIYELDCHIKGVEGLTFVIRVERTPEWGEAALREAVQGVPGWGEGVQGAPGRGEAELRGQGMEHLNVCLLQLQLQSQEVLSKDDWMDSTLKTAITTAGIVISVFMIIFIFYSCKAL